MFFERISMKKNISEVRRSIPCILRSATNVVRGLVQIDGTIRLYTNKLKAKDSMIALLRKENNLLREKLKIPKNKSVSLYTFKDFPGSIDMMTLSVEEIFPLCNGLDRFSKATRNRAISILKMVDLDTVQALCQKSSIKELRRYRNFGPNAADMIVVSMDHFGLKFSPPILGSNAR